MSTQLSKIVSAASISFALAFTFSCSGDDSDSNEQSYKYCIKADNTCLTGPFTASTCNGQPSNSCPPKSSSSYAIVPSSSSKAVVQEYCVYKELCGVIEPIGSPIGCSKGTKRDYCPYGYEKINLSLLEKCTSTSACSSVDLSPYCKTCGGIQNSNGSCTVYFKFCR